MVIMYRYFIFLLIILGNATQLYAQVEVLRFENYTSQNGLTQNSGYSLSQTPEGFMWFGTQDGLNRFDGYRLKVYRKTADTNSICANQINALCTDSKGNLWIGTPEGACVYIPLTDKFISLSNYLHCKPELNQLNTCFFLEDAKADMWIGTVGQGVFVYNKAQQKIFSYFTDAASRIRLGKIKRGAANEVCVSMGNDV
jgi:ligand-binding sensor domain-containing protein